MAITLSYYVLLNLQIVVNKIGSVYAVGHNASYFGGCQNHILGLFCIKKRFHRCPVKQIQFSVGTPHQVGIPFCLQVVPYGRAYQTTVTRYIYLCVFIHYSK